MVEIHAFKNHWNRWIISKLCLSFDCLFFWLRQCDKSPDVSQVLSDRSKINTSGQCWVSQLIGQLSLLPNVKRSVWVREFILICIRDVHSHDGDRVENFEDSVHQMVFVPGYSVGSESDDCEDVVVHSDVMQQPHFDKVSPRHVCEVFPNFFVEVLFESLVAAVSYWSAHP